MTKAMLTVVNDTFDTAVHTVIVLAVLAVAAIPAIIGAVRDRRIDTRPRDAEADRDRRTGVLLVFDLAYGPHEDRAVRARALRGTGRRRPGGAAGDGQR
ncbi:hypothetical protein ACRAR1_18315 [Streptomyces sanyensis]|uniref:hypothetical protein n=1 Tax=Streptomyces sanyensis TaxID=568869 RepID=UPI003D785ACF